MPRISGDSLAAHVEHQKRAVFDAAIRLFVERGYATVSMGDIATEVGLARNSLYRYFPDKASILLSWYHAEIPIQVARSTEILTGDGTVADRLVAWANAQINYALQPRHALFESLAQATASLSADARAEFMDGHARLVAPFRAALVEAGLDDDRLDATMDLLWAMVMTQTQREARGKERAPGRAVLASLLAAVCTDDFRGTAGLGRA